MRALVNLAHTDDYFPYTSFAAMVAPTLITPPSSLAAPPQAPTAGLRYLADHVQAAICAPVDEMAERMEIVFSAAVADRGLVPAEKRRANPERYTRHILHADPGGRFCIVALVWGPGQFSPVHGHHTWCAYAVLGGTLTETTYSYDAQTGLATPVASETLKFGASRFEYAGLSAVHKLGNAEDNVALSLHIYGIDGARVGTHVNRLVKPAHH